jgi:hypothetical protein
VRRPLALAVATLAVVVAACTGSDDPPTAAGGTDAPPAVSDAPSSPSSPTTAAAAATAATAAVEPYTSEVYDGTTNWLCHPDLADDVCDTDLTVTVVAADGTRSTVTTERIAEPAVDCLYVYPTVSVDPPPNADLIPGAEEERAVLNQAAPFADVCRLYAPVYRQVTIAGLFGGDAETAFANAYLDVVDAWRHYLANENDGRPVVLIGHSQGAGHLNRLLREEVDPDPGERARLVSALLLGSAVAVPAGADVGGDLQEIPLCRASDQTGCVVTYATFLDTGPPPPTSFFGRPRGGGGVAGCTNPAALAGGEAAVRPWFRTENVGPAAAGVTSPYVSFTDVVTARCVARDGFSYLEVTVEGDTALRASPVTSAGLGPEWGLHLVDANIAMGDLVDLVGSQAAAHTG